MRVYSSSQGRFIDTPDTGRYASTPSDNANSVPNTMNSAIPPISDTSKLFALLALKKKDYQTAYDILNPKPDANILKEQQSQQKSQQGANQMNELVKTLEGHYQKGGGGATNVPILSNLLGVKQNIEGALNWNPDITQYNAQKAGFIAALKGLTGDVGVMTDQDAIRLMNLFPKFGDRGDVAAGKFNDIRNFISTKFGTTNQKSTYTPENKNILQVLMPNATGIAQDVGTGIRGKMEQGNLDKQSQMAKQLEDRAYATSDLRLRKSLLQQANNLRTGVSNEAGDISRSFSKDVNGNPIGRAIGGAGEIATAAEIPGGIKAGVNFAKGGGRKIADLFGNGALEARKTAAQGVKIDTSSIIDAGNNYVKNIDPAAKKAWDTLKPSLKKETDLPTLLEKLTNWGDKSFTKSGDKRAVTEGLLKSYLYKEGRQTIADQAPEVAQLTSKISRNMAVKSGLKTVGKTAAYGTAGAIASTPINILLYNLLKPKSF